MYSVEKIPAMPYLRNDENNRRGQQGRGGYSALHRKAAQSRCPDPNKVQHIDTGIQKQPITVAVSTQLWMQLRMASKS